MSISVMAAVWDDERIARRDLLVALAIADHADDEGRCFPSIDRIALKARVSRRSAIDSVARLQADGIVQVELNKGPHGTNVYTIGGCKSCTRANSAPVQNAALKLHPNRKEPPVTKKSAGASVHPVPIAMYVERHGTPPPLIWYEQITNRVADLDLWKLTLDEWEQSGYRLKNLAGLLQCYERNAKVIKGRADGTKDAMTWEEMEAHAKKNRLTPVRDYEQTDEKDGRDRPKWRPKA